MRRLVLIAALPLLAATPALAQHEGHPPAAAPQPAQAPVQSDDSDADDAMEAMDWPTEVPAGEAPQSDMPGMAGIDHAAMGHDAPGQAVGSEPAPAPPTDYAAEQFYDPSVMAPSRAQLRQEHGGTRVSKFMVDLGEWQFRDGADGYRWDAEAWYGGDINRLVIRTEGEGETGFGIESGDVEALYSRAISPYFDLQAGIRQDVQRGARRTYATVGFEGVAPYWFDTEGALFLSDEGDLLGRLEGSYDLRLTQRWILQPRAEVNLSSEDIPEMGIGSGVSTVELGLRLRYEVRREFAPYIGVSFDRKLGATADFARAIGEDDEATSLVVGVRTWF